MKKILIPVIFWTLIGFFLMIVSQICIPAVTDIFRGSLLFLAPFIIFSLLGVALIIFTFRKKVRGRLKAFLLLTGASAAGFFVGVFLHNAFYALAEVTAHIPVLSWLAEVLHVAFFILAIILCPLGFLTGVVGSIVLFIKKRKK